MKRITKMLGLSVAALLAFAAFAAASASASQPQFVLEAGQTFPESFTSTKTFGPGEGYLTTRDRQHKVQCTASTTEGGEITSATEAKAKSIRFTGCTDVGTGISCGEIPTVPVKAETVYWGSSKNKAGLWFKPQSGSIFAEFNCGAPPFFGTHITVRGGVIGQIGTVNSPVTANTITFATEVVGTEEIQVPRSYWASGGCGSVLDVLESSGSGIVNWAFQESAINGSAPVNTPHKVEVKSSSCV
jgi:hypothetical protein